MNEQLSAYLTPTSLVSTWMMVVSPELSIRRVVETVELAEASVLRQVSIDLCLTTSDPFLVPILRPRRGLLVDNLQLDKGAQFALNRQEVIAVSIQLIRRIVRTTLLKHGRSIDHPSARRIVHQFCQIPVRRPEASLSLMRQMQGLQRLEMRGERLADLPRLGEYLLCLDALSRDREFLDLMEFFRTNRLLLVPYSPSSGHEIAFRYETPLRETAPGGSYHALRGALGHAPYNLRFEVPLAIRTPSYHFRLRTPSGQYVAKQTILVPRFAVQSRLNPPDWELMRLPRQRSLGFIEGDHATTTNYSHLYLGNVHMDAVVPRRLFVAIGIRERPLGEMAKAFLKISLCFGVLLSVAIFGSNLVHQGTGSSDAIAILVFLPGLVAYVSTSRSAIGEIVISPLVARIGPTIATYCSLVGSILVLGWSASGNKDSIIWDMPPGIFLGFSIVLFLLLIFMMWTAMRVIVGVATFKSAQKDEASTSMK